MTIMEKMKKEVKDFRIKFFESLIKYIIIFATIGTCVFSHFYCCVPEKLYTDIVITLIAFLGVLLSSLVVALSIVVRGFHERYTKAEEIYENNKTRENERERDNINLYWKYYLKTCRYLFLTISICIFLFILFLIFQWPYFLPVSVAISGGITYVSIEFIIEDYFANPFEKRMK